MTAAMTQHRFATALLDPGLSVEDLASWNGSDPAQRFNVYRNTVVVSLSEALREKFPVVAELVGAEFFLNMARHHVRTSPPRSPMLARYGDDLADFIATYPPAAPVPYLADVARLEAARVSAYHAADAPVLGPDDFAWIEPDRLADVVLVLHPSARLLRSRHAIYALWAAHQGAFDIRSVDPGVPEDVLVLRPHDDVFVTNLPPGAATVFAHLAAGNTLGDALAAAAGEDGFDAISVFRLFVSSGAVSAIHLSGECP